MNNDQKVSPPSNCRQRLAVEGKPYPRSSCEVCGQFSPKSRDCDALLSAQPALQPPAGAAAKVLNLESAAKTLAAVMDWNWERLSSQCQGMLCANARTVAEAAYPALQARLQAAEAERDQLKAQVAELSKDRYRLDAIESGCWDVRFTSSAIADTGDSSTAIEIVGHWMDKPWERVIGENYNERLRPAIDQAMLAPDYPPARPEYPDIDAALAKQGGQS